MSAFSPPPHPGAATEASSARMRATRTRDTTPERLLRSSLRALGVVGYRLHWPVLPRRTADLAFPGRRVAVFVDGCFWHGCPQHARPVGANGEWWATKLELNRRRDDDTNRRLVAMGWTPIRCWEHDDPDEVARLIQGALRYEPGVMSSLLRPGIGWTFISVPQRKVARVA